MDTAPIAPVSLLASGSRPSRETQEDTAVPGDQDETPAPPWPVRPRRTWTRHRVELATLAVALVGVLVALGAWLLPRDPGRTPAGPGPTAGPAPTVPGTDPATGTTQPAPDGPPRYLVELTPAVGGGTVQRTGDRSLVMACGTGESDDRQREVTYDLPRTGYRTFRTTARPAGQRDTRLQVTVIVDGTVATRPVLTAGAVRELAADVAGASRLTLRITCDPGAGPATFTDPGLYR